MTIDRGLLVGAVACTLLGMAMLTARLLASALGVLP